VFRRRRREQADRPGFGSGTGQDDLESYDDSDDLDDVDDIDDPDDPDDPDEAADAGSPVPAARAPGRAVSVAEPEEDWGGRTGPWNGAEPYPHRERIDFGSLLIPVYEGINVEVEVAEGMGVCVTIVRDESVLQLMAFAAPKTSGLWEEVRQEFAEEVRKSGGESQEAQGPFGVELQAQVPASSETARRGALEPVRFLGMDGPRWFLRGMIRGPAARRQDLAQPFEDLFADVVVVRGDHPAPPGDLLEIRLPDDMRQALAAQMEQENAGPDFLNPFDRGPEITETR
jgi:hypothetical protein